MCVTDAHKHAMYSLWLCNQSNLSQMGCTNFPLLKEGGTRTAITHHN